jgi:hypothetical protein
LHPRKEKGRILKRTIIIEKNNLYNAFCEKIQVRRAEKRDGYEKNFQNCKNFKHLREGLNFLPGAEKFGAEVLNHRFKNDFFNRCALPSYPLEMA